MRMKGKVAVITGAGRGIGFACAKCFVAEGAKVVLADVEEEMGERAAETLQEAGGDALFVACDVGDKGSVEQLFDKAAAAFCDSELV